MVTATETREKIPNLPHLSWVVDELICPLSEDLCSVQRGGEQPHACFSQGKSWVLKEVFTDKGFQNKALRLDADGTEGTY